MKRSVSSFKLPTFEICNDDQCLPFVFDLPHDRLVLVDYEDMLKHVDISLSNAIMVGFDTETEPFVFCSSDNGRNFHNTALIQMAVRQKSGEEYVYILDLVKLLHNGGY